MSERFAVQFKTETGEWETIKRSGIGQYNGTGQFDHSADAFILLGKEMACDPDMEHRIVRYVEEVVVAPPVGGKA